jgi:hypothetical protein
MADQVELDYTIDPVGASPAAIAAVMGAVPLPEDVIVGLGLRVTADNHALPAATPVKRTIKLAFGPSVIATAIANLDNVGDSGHPILSVTVTAPGADYVVSPQIFFVGGDTIPPSPPNILFIATAKAFLKVVSVALVSGGMNFSAGTTMTVVGGMPPPTFGPDGSFPRPACVQAVNMVNKGRGYSAATEVQFQGGTDSDPTARTATAVITGIGPHGEVLGIRVIDPGQGYVRVPKVILFDPTPTATKRSELAHAAAQMGDGTPAQFALTIAAGAIIAVTLVSGGRGYIRAPEVVIFDPAGTGSGAVITVSMGVGEIDMISHGAGYTSPPTVVINPFFKSNFPDTSDQRAPFWRLFEPALMVADISPVTSAPPIVT